MTGGQVAPTTPEKARTMTTPYGSAEPRFDVCALAQTAGANSCGALDNGTAHAVQKGHGACTEP